ncbi:MAG: sensor histidine kinase, partial [Bifidobacterium crudilactis]|nr:sensor histidine kinase [Bifidobacterium crudilactis]
SKASSLARFIEAAEVGQGNNMGTRYAVVQFSDHGPGVPEASLHQLFERFYTADPSRAREKGGTGLGLAIAFSVVKAHQGMICATQTPGGGLTFTVVLPLGVEERHETPTATSSSDNHGGRKARQNAKAQAKAKSKAKAQTQSKAQARSKVSSPAPQQKSLSSALPAVSNAANSQRDASGGSAYDSHGDAPGVQGLQEPQAEGMQGDGADTGLDNTARHGS